MNLLVLSQDYPRLDGTHERYYVHVRNLYYKKNNIDVEVLNFKAKEKYEIDGIKVLTKRDFNPNGKKYDILIVHAPNIKSHYLFLKKNEKFFTHIVFFFHGQEIMKLNKDYPKPYNYMSSSKKLNVIFRNIYDYMKIKLWKKYLKKLNYKSDYVFVSNYLYNKFKHNFKYNYNKIKSNEHIINNSVGIAFEKEDYNIKSEKQYDFITIRSNLDGSTYCIDLLMKLASKYRNKRFLLIGKGKFFEHNHLPKNVKWINKTIDHKDMISFLNSSKTAIQLTRHDTQGVMSCELATFGIPLITSNIDVCKEIFNDFKNVALVSNEIDNVNLDKVVKELRPSLVKNDKYFEKNTIEKEVELYRKILSGGVDNE